MNGMTKVTQQQAEENVLLCARVKGGRGARIEAGPQASEQWGIVHLLCRKGQLHQPCPLVHRK